MPSRIGGRRRGVNGETLGGHAALTKKRIGFCGRSRLDVATSENEKCRILRAGAVLRGKSHKTPPQRQFRRRLGPQNDEKSLKKDSSEEFRSGITSRRIPLAKSAKFAKGLRTSQTRLGALGVLGEKNGPGRGGADGTACRPYLKSGESGTSGRKWLKIGFTAKNRRI